MLKLVNRLEPRRSAHRILVGTRDVQTQSARARPARAQPACARAQSMPSSCPVPAYAHAQSVPNPPLPKPYHRLTDQVTFGKVETKQ